MVTEDFYMRNSMKTYYVESVIEKIDQNIKALIDKRVITDDKKIVLYGLDTFSFGMRTILANLGFKVDSYISEDSEQVVRYKRYVKAVSSRYLNSLRDLIGIYDLEERLADFDENLLILSGSKNCPKRRLEELKHQEQVNFFQVYDWEQDKFAEFVRDKKKISLKEIQNIEKEMLSQVDQFCIENGIRYWVCGGTLLGTIRHKGFIPWDDDIDLFLPWKDYKRFLEEFKTAGRYDLIIPDKADKKDYFELWAKMIDNHTVVREHVDFMRKVHPVSIDIFPLIGMPRGAEERKRFFEEFSELDKKIWEDFYANNGSLGVYDKWYPSQKKFLEMYDFDESSHVGVLGTAYRENDCTTKKVYDSTLRMPFEDIEVNVPAGFQVYLDNLYGKGWQELPDESRRVSNHNVEAYWL